jgi:hypothetical protein
MHLGIPNQHAAWTPRRLGSSLLGWWRADMGITLVSGVVSAWADQSGNGNHLTQTTAAHRPSYTASHADWNGRPAVSLDGVDDHLRSAAVSLGAFTIVLVGKSTNSGYLVYSTGATDYEFLSGTIFSTIAVVRGATISAKNHTANWMPDAPVRKTIVWSYGGTHATHSLRLNGATPSLGTTLLGDPGVTPSSSSILLGLSAGGAALTTPEAMLVNRTLVDAEIASLEWYLKRMYAHY